MKKASYLTTLLLAASVCRAGSDRLLAAPTKAAARPTATKATKATSTVGDVVNAANDFLNTLSASQKSTVLQAYNSSTVTQWSNLPVNSMNPRIGLRFDALNATQIAAALAVVQASTGTATNEGFNEIQQIRAADDNLKTKQSGGYGSNLYLIAFLGTPSLTGTWQLQFGGHHLATNITYGNGVVTGASPKFEGVEPLSFTTANSDVLPAGNTYAPLSDEAAVMLAMISGLSSANKTAAKVTNQTFGDVVLGPNGNGQFPTTNRLGVLGSALSTAEQALVVKAMEPWIKDSDDATAANLLATYKSQLANTYIAYSGTGNFTSNADYARIDGPNCWIEFVCQNGVIYSGIHYHTVWRDRARDYGGNFYGTYTNTLGSREAIAASVFGIYPNPITAGSSLQVQLLVPAGNATYTLRSLLGQTLATSTFQGSSVAVPTAGLAPGTYTLTVETPSQKAVTSRVQVD